MVVAAAVVVGAAGAGVVVVVGAAGAGVVATAWQLAAPVTL